MECVCCKLFFHNSSNYINHLESSNREQTSYEYICCGKIFHNKKRFVQHLKIHFSSDHNSSDNQSLSLRESNEIENNSFPDSQVLNDAPQNQLSNLNVYKSNFIKFLLRNLSKNSTTRQSCFEFGGEALSFFKDFLKTLFVKNEVNVYDLELNNFLLYLNNSQNVVSEHIFFKELDLLGSLITYKKVVIDKKLTSVYPVTKYDDRNVYLLNVKSLLEKLFMNLNFSDKFFDHYHNIVQNDDLNDISNILQTQHWKQKIEALNPDDSTIFVPLVLYNDDFESLNPIGVHSGAYSINGSYIKLGILPPEFTSKLDFIWPIQFSFANDKKDYGNNQIFYNLIEDLNFLFDTGIDVNYLNIKKIKFVVVKVIGDNKGVHELFEFVCNFSKAFYFCRFCRCHNEEIKVAVSDKPFRKRTLDNYKADLVRNNSKESGIKKDSIFNSLKQFHIIDDSCADVMHDLLEGVCKIDMAIVIKNFVFVEKSFTLIYLNNRISSFDYGPNSLNKPDNVTKENLDNFSLKFTAAQTLNLILNFNLMFGTLIENVEENVFWKFYLLIRKITIICLKISISSNDSKYLSQLVTEHHKLKLNLFGRLKYKDHVLNHYKELMSKSGPLQQFSNMRYEGKHNEFKKSLSASANHINLLVSLSIKAQIKYANFLLNFNFASSFIEKSKEKLLKPEEEIELSKLFTTFENVKFYDKINVLGKNVEKNVVFETYDEENCTIILGKVLKIAVTTNEKVVVYKLLKNVKTCDNLDCYEFKEESVELFLINLSDIDLTRLSYVYYSLHGTFVNLNIQ